MTELELLEAILAELEAGNAHAERIAIYSVAISHLLHLAAAFCFWLWVAAFCSWKSAFDSRL